MSKLTTSIKRFILGLKRPSKRTNLQRLEMRGESLASFVIREAEMDDVAELAALHVQTWKETYWTTPVPPSIDIRRTQWDQQFKLSDESWFCLVVENSKGDLVGFAKGQSYSHEDLPEFSGELNKIYLLSDYQRIGLGRKLVGHVARRFLGQGINNMVLFGTPENPSCKFYEVLGGERLYAKNGDFHGGYCWRDLEKLSEICPIG